MITSFVHSVLISWIPVDVQVLTQYLNVVISQNIEYLLARALYDSPVTVMPLVPTAVAICKSQEILIVSHQIKSAGS